MQWFSAKTILSLSIILATLTAFVLYLQRHPEFITQLRHTHPADIGLLVGINALLLSILSGIYALTARLSGCVLATRENFLLTIYSTIANFFGPLQSGPGVRAAYLRSKHGVKLKAYTAATLLYYGIYAAISALFLLVGTRPWWQTIMFLSIVLAVSWLIIRRFRSVLRNVTPRIILLLCLLTILQLSIVAVRYHVELQAVHAPVSIGQSISYAGAANFALFVSITPDGIGIRESFLLAAQQLHGVSIEHIVAASLLDRASYFVFLGLLFITALSLHAKQILYNSQPSHTPSRTP
jgi:uncharacterized membrane protein YbhN (UPF0104 family)